MNKIKKIKYLKVFDLNFAQDEEMLKEMMNNSKFHVTIKKDDFDKEGRYKVVCWIIEEIDDGVMVEEKPKKKEPELITKMNLHTS